MNMIYLNPCYNNVCYKGTALYCFHYELCHEEKLCQIQLCKLKPNCTLTCFMFKSTMSIRKERLEKFFFFLYVDGSPLIFFLKYMFSFTPIQFAGMCFPLPQNTFLK